jgi:hypothetical protein
LSCLKELNNDHANYLSVSVDESAPGDEQPVPADSVALGVKVAPTKKLALDLGKYNRGIVPPRQKALFAPNKQQYFAQAAEEKIGGRGGAADSPSRAGPDATFEYRAEGAAAEGRAQRLIVPGSDERRLEELRRYGVQSKASTATDAGQLQVLFVLAPGEEAAAASPAAASPAAENRAE